MALNAAQTWYVRKSGNELNGGGWDSTIAGAGTNYADQDATQLSITDLVSTASTTVTSVAGGFTSAMVGNMLRLASATGTPVADSAGSRYLAITGFTDANTLTVDKTSGTYTLGVARIGGAHALERNMSSGGSGLTAPLLTSPLAAGHTVYVRSATSDRDPSIAGTVDYDYSAGWYLFANGTTSAGLIKFIGLSASEAIPTGTNMPLYRPLVKISGIYRQGNYHLHLNFKTFNTSTPAYTAFGLNYGSRSLSLNNIHDCNGAAMQLAYGSNSFIGNWVKNTGGGAANTQAVAGGATYGDVIADNLFTDIRGPAIVLPVGQTGYIVQNNIVANSLGASSISLDCNVSFGGGVCVGNTVYNPTGDGIIFTQAALAIMIIRNNTVSKIASGKFAFKVTAGTAAANDLVKMFFDYNNAYLDGGAGGLYSGISAGTHDVAVDPQFTDPTSATYDFRVGTNLKAKGIGTVLMT